MRHRSLFAACLAAFVVGACATQPAQTDDRIIIPEYAREVDHIDFFGHREWTRLNPHMLVAWAGVTPYLIVFDEGCPRLMTRDAIAISRTNEDALRARFDAIVVEGMPCQIDRIYAVTKEDVTALRKELEG